MMNNCDVIFVTLLGILCCIYTDCTSTHNLHNLLRHPHYAEGHQHALQHHLQHSTAHPQKKLYDGRHSFSSSPYSAAATLRTRESTNDDGGSSLGPWSRTSTVVTKDYYKMNALKSTSATKSVQLIDPRIPQELSEVREASEHFVRMRSEAGCRIPRPQVVCVRDVYPGKNFLPRCTLLHRCTEATGCCEDETTQCSPKAMQEVVMLFYVLGGDHRSTDVEKLLFVNHTECECQTKPTNVTTVAPHLLPTPTPGPKKNDDQFPLRDQIYNKCRSCPSPFHSREYEDGVCSCDCFDRHKPCIRVKRGREALQDAERRCVLAGHCNIPECDYGSYDPDRGRCPKRPDQEVFKGSDPHGGKRPIPNHKNPNHRWTYFERD